MVSQGVGRDGVDAHRGGGFCGNLVDEEAVAAADEISLRSLGGKELIRSHGKHRTELDGRRESQNTEIYSREFRRRGVLTTD